MAMKEFPNLVSMKGTPLVLVGKEVQVGKKAPGFKVIDLDSKPVSLSDFSGKFCIISAVPSLDTSVCAAQTKRFSSEVSSLPPNSVVLTISMDLPFAQKRFCDTENIHNVKVLSDHIWREFGTKYGILVKDLGLLARSVFVVDGRGIIMHKEIVPDMGDEPNYEAAIKVVTQLASQAQTKAA